MDETNTNNIKKLLLKRTRIISQIYGQVTDYLPNIQEFIEKFNKDNKQLNESNELIIANIDEAKILIEKIDLNLALLPTLNNLSALFDIFEGTDKLIDDIMSIINSNVYFEPLLYNMSQTFSRDINLKRINLSKLIAEYKRAIVDNEMKMTYKMIYTDIKPLENIAIIATYMDSLNNVNDLAVYICTRVVKELSDDVDSDMVTRFMNRVEHLKTVTLSTDKDVEPVKKIQLENISVLQMLTVKYGLIPITEYLNVGDMFEYLQQDYNFDKSPQTNMQALSNTHNVLVIHKYTEKLIQFNILPLISEEYVKKNQLETNPINGLNNRIINRFSTVKIVPGEPTKIPQNVKPIEVYKNTGNNQWFIIECVSFKHYKLLSTSFEKNTVDTALVDNLLSGLSTRPHNYNKIIEDEVLANINENHRTIISTYESEKTSMISTDRIKRDIKKNVIDAFTDLYKESNIENKSDMRKLFSNNDIIDMLTSALEEELSNLILEKDDIESTLTFVAQLDILLTKFLREYKVLTAELFTSQKIIDMKFKELSGKDLENYVLGWFSDVLNEATETLDTKPISLVDIELSLKEHAVEIKTRL